MGTACQRKVEIAHNAEAKWQERAVIAEDSAVILKSKLGRLTEIIGEVTRLTDRSEQLRQSLSTDLWHLQQQQQQQLPQLPQLDTICSPKWEESAQQLTFAVEKPLGGDADAGDSTAPRQDSKQRPVLPIKARHNEAHDDLIRDPSSPLGCPIVVCRMDVEG